MGPAILFVDDEKAILKTFQRSLRGSEWEIFTAEDGQAALSILATQNIDIIISDMRMPNMNGHQLLRKVKEMYPATIRLILSGHAEEKDITRAMLDGSCKMYILKPWDSPSLAKTIRQLLDVREVLRERKLLAIINRMDGLCVLPRIFHQLTEMIGNDADMQQIAAVIEEDPVMAARILRMVNSAFYGIKTGSVRQALTYLGLMTVKSIVLATSLCEMMPEWDIGMFNKESLWRNSSMMNRLVSRLYHKLTGRNIPPMAASTGLLFNIGLMALVQQMPDKYRQIASAIKERPELPLDDLEREIIGVSHHEVGGYLLDWWGLPQPVIESVMFHHNPFHDSVGNRELVSVMHIACHYALRMLYPGSNVRVDERAFALFNITAEECERLIKEEIHS